MLKVVMLTVMAFVDGQMVQVQDLHTTMDECLTAAEAVVETSHVVALSCDYIQVDEQLYTVNFGEIV